MSAIPSLKAQYTNYILGGKLPLPEQIIALVGEDHRDIAERTFRAFWKMYIVAKKPTSLAYWADQWDDKKALNRFLKHLSKSGWIVTTVLPNRNWAEVQLNETKLLQFVTPEQLASVRKSSKYDSYKMGQAEVAELAPTKMGREKLDTGLRRPGFTKAGKSQFKYDTVMLAKYYGYVETNLTKSIDKIADKYELIADGADYKSISTSILRDHLANPDKVLNTGTSMKDSRGRAISASLSKVFNAISNKDARALIIVEKTVPANPIIRLKLVRNVNLFIAELLGYKAETFADKAELGAKAYETRELHDLSILDHIMEEEDEEHEDKILAAQENALKDVHENIWLERLYNELDKHYASQGAEYTWTVPIELDGTASMIQIEGALLGHAPFLEKTNCWGGVLEDVWTFKNVQRKTFKTALTPILYGSSSTPKQLWDKNKMPYTPEDLVDTVRELRNGELSVANKFKDFIIDNVQPEEEMMVKVWNEEFKIRCNRFKNVGEYTKSYRLYDTKDGIVKTIHHTTTKQVADLKQFRRYFVTLLVHNLDSQVMDYTVDGVSWAIPIHDAAIVHPLDADTVRERYTSKITAIYKDRGTILKDYFASVGIHNPSAWTKLKEAILPVSPEFECQPTALK